VLPSHDRHVPWMGTRYYTGEALWPFGFGLSYTTFALSVVGGGPVAATTEEVARAFEEYYRMKGIGR
jgi:hypothetical protein